jgi:hypothetical protein
MEQIKNNQFITDFIDKVKRNPIKTVIFSLLILLAIYILYNSLIKFVYYYAKYQIRDNSSIKYNKTLTNEIDLVLTKYILTKGDHNPFKMQEGIEKLSENEKNLINEIGSALCNFNELTSDVKLKDAIVTVLAKHQDPSLENLKSQINAQIDEKKLDAKDNRLAKQKVTKENLEDTKNFNRYLAIAKKNKGSSYGYFMKKTICGTISKDATKKYLESKYVKVHLFKKDFENEYDIAYGIAKDGWKDEFSFSKFLQEYSGRKIKEIALKDQTKNANFDLQNGSRGEYFLYKLFQTIDPEKYQNLKERKIIGKKGIVAKLIPTIKRKLSDASPKEMIKCLIESMIVELHDIVKSDNYLITSNDVLNIDFGTRLDNLNEKMETLITNISTKSINPIKQTLQNIVEEIFPIELKSIDAQNQCTEIIDAMHNAINNIKNDEIIEILDEVISQDKYNSMKKLCDDFYNDPKNKDYVAHHPKKQSDTYLELVNAFEGSGFKRSSV